MKTISSRQNALFKRLRTALREHDREIVIEGPKQVADAIAGGWKPIAVINRGEQFTDELFDSLAETRTPQNVIALFERPSATFAEIIARRDTIAVALDGVQDPGNVGTIVRLAAAFDCAGVALLPGCADAFSPKAIRSSAGSVLNVPIAETTHDEVIASGLPIFAADPRAETSQPPARSAILVFGSEGPGVSDKIRRAAKTIRIEMSDRVESLNVAASAAILLSRSYAGRR